MAGHGTCSVVSTGSWYFEIAYLGHWSAISESLGGHKWTCCQIPPGCHVGCGTPHGNTCWCGTPPPHFCNNPLIFSASFTPFSSSPTHVGLELWGRHKLGNVSTRRGELAVLALFGWGGRICLERRCDGVGEPRAQLSTMSACEEEGLVGGVFGEGERNSACARAKHDYSDDNAEDGLVEGVLRWFGNRGLPWHGGEDRRRGTPKQGRIGEVACRT